jgi:hypothetical protein
MDKNIDYLGYEVSHEKVHIPATVQPGRSFLMYASFHSVNFGPRILLTSTFY